jgi:iron complex outermembrane receptor protein
MKLAPLAVAVSAALAGVSAQAQIEEITVTARKVEESLQDVPVAVTAFSRQDMNRRGIESLADIAAFTPGLSFEDYNGSLEAPVIRGQNQVRLSNPVQNVSTFLDGVYLQRGYMIDTGVLSLERIEVVKGPQSALYGQNSFSGAINYVPKKPSEEFEANIEGTFGSDELERVVVSASGPIIKDRLLGRITYGSDEFDGTWENGHPLAGQAPNPGTEGNLGGYDNETLAVNLTFRPTDTLSLELGYYRNETLQEARPTFTRMGRDGVSFFGFTDQNTTNCSNTANPGLPFLSGNTFICGELGTDLPAAGSNDQGDIVFDPRSFAQDGTNEVATFRIDYDISDAWSVHYLYGWADSEIRAGGQSVPDAIRGSGNPASLLNFSPGSVVFDSQLNGGLEADSHELRLDFNSGRLIEASVGVFLYQSDDIYEAIGYFLEPLGTTALTDLPNRGPETLLGNDTQAIFGRIGLNFMDGRLRVSAEARYAEEEISVETIDVAGTSRDETFTQFTPRFTVDYDLTDQNLVYFSAANGAKAGGFNNPVIGQPPFPVDPSQETYDIEENWTYEIGTKSTFLDGKLLANLALFYIDWSDLQINAPLITPDGYQGLAPVIITNIGGASTWGVELEGAWNPIEPLSINYGVSYNDPTFDDGVIYIEAANDGWCDGVVCPTDGDIGGNNLNRTPKVQGVLGAQWEGQLSDNLGYYIRGDLTYQSKQYMELLNVGWIPERTLVNARAAITGDKWEVALWARNLFDEEYVSSSLFLGFSNGYTAFLGRQQQLGLTATYAF